MEFVIIASETLEELKSLIPVVYSYSLKVTMKFVYALLF